MDAVKSLLDTRAANGASPLHVVQGSGTGQVPIFLGDPGDSRTDEMVVIAPTTNTDRTPESSGSVVPTFIEEFVLPVIVLAQRLGDDYKATRDRAESLSEDIRSTLETGQALTIAAGLQDAYVEGLGWSQGMLTDGWSVEVTVRVRCKAYP
jgi:hypothetical protein